MKMIFDERFGSIPADLSTTMRKHNVTPGEFYFMEDMGIDVLDMNQYILDHLVMSASGRWWFMLPEWTF